MLADIDGSDNKQSQPVPTANLDPINVLLQLGPTPLEPPFKKEVMNGEAKTTAIATTPFKNKKPAIAFDLEISDISPDNTKLL